MCNLLLVSKLVLYLSLLFDQKTLTKQRIDQFDRSRCKFHHGLADIVEIPGNLRRPFHSDLASFFLGLGILRFIS
jgi:hypothetical protein